MFSQYDAVSDVVEYGGHWRSNFQVGSRVLKNVINLFLCISMATAVRLHVFLVLVNSIEQKL